VSTPKPKPDLRLITRFEDQNHGCGDLYLIFTAEVATMTDDGLRYPYLHETGGEFTGLSVRAQLHARHSSGMYGYAAEFRGTNGLDLRTLRSMATTLARVDRKMAALVERFGYPVDLAAYLSNLADSIGVTTKYCFGQHIGRGETDITGTGYRWMEATYLRNHIETQIAAWRTKHGLTVPAAA
jgi:hypothetical protein